MNWKNVLAVGIVTCVLFASRQVGAGEPSHYLPGMLPIRVVAVPPPGVYYMQFNLGNHISDSGRVEEVLTIPHVQPPLRLDVSADVDVDYNMISAVPTGMWITHEKFLSADYGGLLMVPGVYVDTDLKGSFNVEVEGGGPSRSVRGKKDESQFNLGDVFFMPIMLGWHWPRFDMMVNYGFYSPTGKYNTHDVDNTGLGFFEHQFQLGGIGYLDDHKSLGLAVLGTYEIPHGSTSANITPGEDVVLEYGISKVFKQIFEVGVRGYSMWQVERDSGSDLEVKSDKYRANGVGGQLSYTIPKWKANIELSFMQDVANTNRPEASFTVLTFTKGF